MTTSHSELPAKFPGGCRIGREEESAVPEVLRSRSLFRYYGAVERPSAVSSGTAALATALAAFGIGPGDEVIVPAYTWISTPAAVLAVGGVPIVADVDAPLTIDVGDAERKVTDQTKAIIPVHMRSAPVDMAAVLAPARRHDLTILDDRGGVRGGRDSRPRVAGGAVKGRDR